MRSKLLLLLAVALLVISMDVRSITVAQGEVDWDELCSIYPTMSECESRVEKPATEQLVGEIEMEASEADCLITGKGTNLRFGTSINESRWGSLHNGVTIPSSSAILGDDGNSWFPIQMFNETIYARADAVTYEGDCGEIIQISTSASVSGAELEGQAPTQAPDQGQAEQPVIQATEVATQPLVEPPPVDVQPTAVPPIDPTVAPVVRERRDAATYGQTDENGGTYVAFTVGEAVLGAYIVYDDGTTCDSNCYNASAGTGGRVYGGVVNPWDSEIPQ